MLNNLRSVYFQRQEPLKAIEVLSLLIDADPGSPDEYKQRGVASLRSSGLRRPARTLGRTCAFARRA